VYKRIFTPSSAKTHVNNKIILGTVQLGLSYGINNGLGKPSTKQAFEILDYAHEKGLWILDSADGYGDALKTIGSYIKKTSKSFNVINKFKFDEQDFRARFAKCLEELSTDSLYCYMYHHFPDYESGSAKIELKELKNSGKIEKVGVSLYSTDQLRKVVMDNDIDIIQLPVNLLDLDSKKETLLEEAKARGKEIHARSVFLQGLFFMDPDSLSENLSSMKPYLETLRSTADGFKCDLKKIALNYVLKKNCVDYVVLGVETVEQLEDNLAMVDPDFSVDFENIIVKSEDRYLLNPANWKA
jgi:aryl-alcohol dehydrogenase-like predicted oxidoreductase